MIVSGISIRRLQNEEALERAFAKGLIALYQDIFAEKPYFEMWETDVVERTFRHSFENGIVFLAYDDESGRPIGFGCAVPFPHSTVEKHEWPPSLDPSATWYMSELGVEKAFRRRGIGQTLVEKRIEHRPSGFTHVLMRTAQTGSLSAPLYYALGFEKMQETTRFSHKRKDGTMHEAVRILLVKEFPDG